MNKKEFELKDLRAQWERFCEEHDDDRWESIAARIDEEAAHIAPPKPKSPRRPVVYAISACVAAAAVMLACLPLMGGWDGLIIAPTHGDNEGSASTSTTVNDTTTQSTTQESTQSTTQSTTTTTVTTTTTTDTKPTTPAIRPYPSGVGTGGDIYDGDFCYIGGFKHSGLMNFFLDYARQNVPEKVDAAIEKIAQMHTSTSYMFTGDSMHFYVRELNISREKFIELNERSKEFYGDNEEMLAEHTYTDEEIDDIYNLSIKEFNEKYKAPTAVLVGEYIYAFDWLYKNDINLWKKQNFTVEQLQDAVANANATPYFPQDIILVVEEKLILFAAEKAGVTIPNSGDGRYNTYISHARWRGIGDAYSQYILQHHSQEAIDAFKAQLAAEQSGDDYAFKGDAINRWVAHFEIPRAAFEQINTQQKTYYKDTYGEDSFEYWDNVYTDEEIDDIYTLSLADFNMKYANPCTLVVGEELYPFGWFLENRMSKWWEELEIREKYLEALLVEFKKVYPDESEDIDNYAEKLEDYINNHGK